MKNFLLLLFSLLLICSCTKNQEPTDNINSDLNERKVKIENLEQAHISEDQEARRQKSIKYCELNDIPTTEHLPVVESIDSVKIRSKEEIVNRAFVLAYLGIKSEGLDAENLAKFENKYSIQNQFSPVELSFKNSPEPSEQQLINANWRYEGLHVLLWTLGYIDDLSFPSEACDVATDVKLIFPKTREEFITEAKLRSKEEILDETDLIYRIHWACVNARVSNKPAPAKLNPSVVYERHYVLNWLINYMNQNWDDVSTDT